MATNRRYDIDWLRVIAIALLLMYHIGIAFQPWGFFIGFIQNDRSMGSLWKSMSLLNIWRIPILFFISGMGVSFALRKRNWKQLISERSKRILIPLVFGIFFIVPIHIFLKQKYYMQDISYSPSLSHLWFLANIFAYVLILLPVFHHIKTKTQSLFSKGFKKIFNSPAGLLLIIIMFIAETLIADPEVFEAYAVTFHGFFLGFIAFFFGYAIIQTGAGSQLLIVKGRWLYLFIATALFSVRLLIFELNAPKYMSSVESVLWIFTVFGFAFKYLNKPSRILSYLSQAVYPIYIIHMVFLYLASYFIMPTEMTAEMKFVLITLCTFLGSFTFYELLIRRISYLRPLFGLKTT